MNEPWQQVRETAEQTFERHYNACVDFIPKFNFSIDHQQQVLALCLYCSIVELCPSLLLLMKRGQFIGVPLLVRTMYEADVDLVNALNYENYFKTLRAGYLKRIISVIQNAYIAEAPGFLNATGGKEDMEKVLAEKRTELDVLRVDGHKPLTIAERFKLANRGEEYISAYAYLCGYAHNDVAALESRHLRRNATESGKVELVLFGGLGMANETRLIDLADSVLLDASMRVHRFYKSGLELEAEKMFEESSKLRSRWPRDK